MTCVNTQTKKREVLSIFFGITVHQDISSAKNFVKSDRQAVRQEFIFVKRRPLFCFWFIFTFMNISDPTFVVL